MRGINCYVYLHDMRKEEKEKVHGKVANFMNINKGLKWIAVSIAVCFAIYITKSANCLWAFMFPIMTD